MRTEPTAGDRYRLEVSQGSLFAGLFSVRPGKAGSKKGAKVAIIDLMGKPVWERVCRDRLERDHLIDVIRTQVFTAGLTDFEFWLQNNVGDRG